MTVMITARTPSLNASKRPLLIPQPSLLATLCRLRLPFENSNLYAESIGRAQHSSGEVLELRNQGPTYIGTVVRQSIILSHEQVLKASRCSYRYGVGCQSFWVRASL